MVYHVSKRFLLKKGAEPFFIALFWPFWAYLTSVVINVDMDDEFVISLKNFSVVLFLIVLFINVIRIFYLRKTVLVIDKKGIVYRVRDNVIKFLWTDLSGVKVYKIRGRIIKLDLLPYKKQINLYFFDGLNGLVVDIDKNRKNKECIFMDFIYIQDL
ncbi:hypothetical protein [Vibrio tarriae]|uniref:hypothetical protein n=1 Tax=Vibrio tarriae TaxID=2014742 RepID=UPI000DE3AB7C|nr:hypothetical protein [Vibrio tarriae]RBM32736.1 hypothetical protein DLR61_01075 [Vibrio tarriae]RBM44558.1 hypothetical protein DLR64_18790 [Vibrio tarriae]